jgi:hypothetical protein
MILIIPKFARRLPLPRRATWSCISTETPERFKAVDVAKKKKLKTVAFTGAKGETL